MSKRPGECQVLSQVCVDHGSLLITHDDKYAVENLRREGTPSFPAMQWSLPLRGENLPDALAGGQPEFAVRVRPVSKVEPTPPLRKPTWSTCTLPVVLMADYPYNIRTFIAQLLTDAHRVLREDRFLMDRLSTIVLATPSGLALEPWHGLLLGPLLSDRPLISLGELGRRGADGERTAWAGEGVRQQCFSKIVVCKFRGNYGSPPAAAAAAVAALSAPPASLALPPDPLRFAASPGAPLPPLGSETTLRVAIEVRKGAWRTIKNAEALVAACEAANAAGFSAGRFTKLSCRALPVGPDTHPPAPGAIDLRGPGATSFLSTLSAVRSAHLLVAVPGSTAAHALFMDTSGAASGGAQPGLLEVRGCGWGTRQAAEANEAQDAMAALLSKGGDTGPLFFALNVEDPSQCSPPNYEAELSAAAAGAAAANTQQQGKEQQQQQQPQAPQGRLDRATAAVRDQHVTLRPASLIAMIKQVAPYLHDRGAYARGRTEGGTHGYVTAEGVVVGPPGVADVAAFAAGKPVLK